LFEDLRGGKGKRDAHVFESVKRGKKVKVFDVKGHILSSWRAEHAVPKDFGRRDVGCPCCEFAGVIDEVPTGCDLGSVGICFLGAMIDNHPCVRNNSIFGDVGDVGGEHDKHCILFPFGPSCCHLDSFFQSLCQTPSSKLPQLRDHSSGVYSC
jgi:hypothetical protein